MIDTEQALRNRWAAAMTEGGWGRAADIEEARVADDWAPDEPSIRFAEALSGTDRTLIGCPWCGRNPATWGLRVINPFRVEMICVVCRWAFQTGLSAPHGAGNEYPKPWDSLYGGLPATIYSGDADRNNQLERTEQDDATG